MAPSPLIPRRRTTLLVVHCSATGPDSDIGCQDITAWHLKRGWAAVGYHYVIRRDGTLEAGRPEGSIGAHVAGHNATSIGVCLVGGLDAAGQPACNYTEAQMASLRRVLGELHGRYPAARIVGHRDLSPDGNGDGVISPNEYLKACPCFDVGEWLAANPLG
ncbi:N-acetylmuramoyl-L-alanine amidase [Pseudomonas sp. NPDC007930]|uniref:N-acetylmuramoyl-L-alanine amidase n=1 Tax=Pseudomonas sp. NPDC007930 TaxID=3364417 RepID=UPI0036E356F4